MLETILDDILRLGGSGWVTTALFIWLFVKERTARDVEHKETVGLVKEMVSANNKVASAVESLKDVVERLDR